jgi:hypothetical protein
MIHTQTVPILVLCALDGAGFAATLALFWSVKREIHSQALKNRRRMEQLARVVQQAPAPPEPVCVPAPARSGVNISKRVQAMRMFRRNEDVSTIAAAVGITRREAELLIRVHHARPQI